MEPIDINNFKQKIDNNHLQHSEQTNQDVSSFSTPKTKSNREIDIAIVRGLFDYAKDNLK